jgi:predicted nucleotidyltransferase component of viral defense system
MLNKSSHQVVLIKILKDVYKDGFLSSILGFKGGTAAFLVYDLPRFSVDLDFDLLRDTPADREQVFIRLREIIAPYGEIKDEQQKFSTIFFALSYGFGEHQIKVEVNVRPTGASYEVKQYLGIPLRVATPASLAAGKLVALTRRKKAVSRDIFDTHFFLQKEWDIDQSVLDAYGVGKLTDYMEECVRFVEQFPENKLLFGLGELVDEKTKHWVKQSLREETVFLLRTRREVLLRGERKEK